MTTPLIWIAESPARWDAGKARIVGDAPAGVWDACPGAFDRPGRVDPHGRLESAVWQARAWQALGAGALEEAGSLAEKAAARVGFSGAAAHAQERLAAALAAARARAAPEPVR